MCIANIRKSRHRKPQRWWKMVLVESHGLESPFMRSWGGFKYKPGENVDNYSFLTHPDQGLHVYTHRRDAEKAVKVLRSPGFWGSTTNLAVVPVTVYPTDVRWLGVTDNVGTGLNGVPCAVVARLRIEPEDYEKALGKPEGD